MTRVYTLSMPARTVRRWNKKKKVYEDEAVPASEERVEIAVNFDEVANLLGVRAVTNAGGKSKALGGAVTARHVRTKK